MTTALVTGARGFCGRHLVERLKREKEVRVVGTGRPLGGASLNGPIQYESLDIRDASATADLFKRIRPDWVFHLAGTNTGRPSDVYATNLVGTANVLEAVAEHAPEGRVLLVGSAAEYGVVPAGAMPVSEDHACAPFTPYGISKFASTQAGLEYHRRRGLRVVVARLFNVVGAHVPETLVVGAVLRRLSDALRPGGIPEVRVGNLDTARDFIAVSDVVDAFIGMVRTESWGRVYNLCSGQPTSIRSVVQELIDLGKRRVELVVDPALVRRSDVDVFFGNPSRAGAAFNFVPRVELTTALREAFDAAVPESVQG